MSRIETLNLSEQITNHLGKAIVCGVYPPDAWLPNESELCEEFGVSRTVVTKPVGS